VIRYGDRWDNAAFDGRVIRVGEGDIFPPFWKSPDIFYHEWGHYFTQETCNLVYSGQAGGNNEHGSDWLAAVTEQWLKGQTAAEASWLIGAGLFAEGLRGRGLRDMLHPGTAYDDPVIGHDGQIQTAEEYRVGMDVHDSSAVGNRAFASACLALGGKSWETLAPVWFDVWTRYLDSRSDFAALARATVTVATERYGVSSRERSAILAGWDLVKVPISGGSDPTPKPPASDPSDCFADFAALLNDAEARTALRSLLATPSARRLLVRARAFSIKGVR
jgi:Zn-dependent metalloprotease